MCKTFFDKSASTAQKDAALRTAVKNHGTLTREALMGKGWDRHMFALKYEALQNGLALPGIYQDASYHRLSDIILSTSTLSSPVLNGGGFGPTGSKCYGIGYTTGTLRGVLDPSIEGQDGFATSVMAYTDQRDPAAFTASIQNSLRLLREVLDASPDKP